MARVTGYQVNVSFGTPPFLYVNLYDGDTQVGRIEVDDPAFFPHLALAIDMLRTGTNVEWDENAQVLFFGMEATGGL